MNKLWALIFLFFASNVSALHFSVIEGKYDCPEIHNSMMCARSIEKALSEKYSFIQRVTEKSLLIVLPVHGERRFNDNDVAFSAIEYVGEFGYLILARQYWEGSGYSLLNLQSGYLYNLSGYPLFSPDGKYVVVVNQDLDAGYSPNTLQIYSAAENMKLVYDAEPKDWGPDNVQWLNESTVSLERAEIPESYDPFSKDPSQRERYKKESATLKKVGAHWEFTLNKSSKRDAVTGAPS